MSEANVEAIDIEVDLIYSPDDNGWYFQRATDFKMSQLFTDKELAMNAYRNNTIEWEK